MDQGVFGLALEEETVEKMANSSQPPLNGASFKLNGLSNKTVGGKDNVKLQVCVYVGTGCCIG